MQAVDNSETRLSITGELPNNPVNKRITCIQEMHRACSCRSLILYSPFKLLNCLDSTFEEFTEHILWTINLTFKEFKKGLNDLCEKYII